MANSFEKLLEAMSEERRQRIKRATEHAVNTSEEFKRALEKAKESCPDCGALCGPTTGDKE